MHNAVCVVKQILLLKKEEHFLIGSRDSFQYSGLYYMDGLSSPTMLTMTSNLNDF